MRGGNLFDGAGSDAHEEITDLLASGNGVRIERIVSSGQASAPGFWYDQAWTEWVLLLSGSSGLLIEGEDSPRALKAGDYIELPAHMRHRVEWTDASQPTVWLAIHFTS